MEEDKKLNNDSYNVKNVFNQNIDDNNVENINELYDRLNNLITVSQLNNKLYNGENIISGNKILRTILLNGYTELNYTFSNLYSWIGSNNKVSWKDEGNGSKFITWPSYNYHMNNDNKNKLAVEWRMLEGRFKLTDEQMDLINRKKVQPILGISTNNEKGFETIIPFSDVINIFINGNITRLNYAHNSSYYKININKQSIGYIQANKSENAKYCNKESHEYITSYIDSKHIDLNILNKNIYAKDNYYKMYGDISEEIIKHKNSQNEYEVQALVGQLSKNGIVETNDYGGIGKIDLLLIENPQVEVNIKPYIFDDNNKKVYKDSKYKFSYNEAVYYDVEIINKSDSYDFTNLSLNLDFLEGTKVSETLKINKNDVTYKGKSIKDDLKLYKNDDKTPINISSLSSLKKNDRILISGDKINHIVSEYDGIAEKINYKSSLEFNYIDNYFFYKYENKNIIEVNPLKGRLTISIDSNHQEEYYVRLSSNNNSANIKLTSKKPYTVFNLDYGKTYKVSLLNSSSYKPIDERSVILNTGTNENKKTITFKPSHKVHKYFTQRKSDSIILNR